MTADALFRLCNSLALAGWLLLVLTGWSPRASRVISSLITGLLVPALLCGLYLVLILTHWGGHRGGFSSLSGVMLLFTDRWLVLAGWVHYLAFDLFIGSWQVRDARLNRVPFVAVLPCLVLTFLFGPIGLLLYLFLAGLISPGNVFQPATILSSLTAR
jgi:ABA4-like protein